MRIIILLPLLISVLKGEIIYETDFDDFTTGPNQWAENDSWISNDVTTGAQAVEQNLLPALLNVATLGFERPNSDLTFVGLNLGYDHVATGKPVIEIDTILGIEDSTNNQRDDFYFSIYNAEGDRLASIRFDNQDPDALNSQFGIWREDGVNQFDTQLDFIPGELYNLFVTINLNANIWSANIDGIPLFENSPFSNTGKPTNIGFIAYEWDLTAVATREHGDNFLLVADILVEASIAHSEIQVNPATVTLNNLGQTYDGNPKPATATTEPAGLAVTITYNGNSVPPAEVGSYAVEATVTDSNYEGSAAGTLVIAQAIPSVTFEFEPSGQISLTWQTSAGWTDQVQYSEDLITWFSDLPSSTFTNDNSPGITTFLPQNDPTAPCRFYRLRRIQSP